MTSKLGVVLFVPNVIGYVRLALMATSIWFGCHDSFLLMGLFHILNALMDFFDGYFARRLGQTSEFGALLDVFIDNASRSAMWVFFASSPKHHKYVVASIVFIVAEWACFVTTHGGSSRHWKDRKGPDQPLFIRAIFKNGFRNPIGATAILSIFLLPLVLVTSDQFVQAMPLVGVDESTGESIVMVLTAYLMAGRLFGFSAELWVIYCYLYQVLEADVDARQSK